MYAGETILPPMILAISRVRSVTNRAIRLAHGRARFAYGRITAAITGQIGRTLFTQGNLVARKRARSRPSFSSILSGSCSRSPRVF
jgi:hypothetical protein